MTVVLAFDHPVLIVYIYDFTPCWTSAYIIGKKLLSDVIVWDPIDRFNPATFCTRL
jgi:hypothetical protein